jgi:quinoprotein glucose dehydrogenase
VGGRFGEMIAVNIATGDIAWRVPLGSTEDDYGEAGKETGSPNIGPSIATKSGLVFIGATADSGFRAFDAKTGKVLWQTKLNGPAVGTPMTFMGKSGRQYVVLPVGGPGVARRNTGPALGYKKVMVAFAIPKPGEQTIDLVGKYPPQLSADGGYWDVQ